MKDGVFADVAGGVLRVVDLGRMSYAEAYEVQQRHHGEVLAARERGGGLGGRVGDLLLVEHDPPVITIPRKPGVREHLLATAERLRVLGVETAETDRGGDITYHGPGQLVAYPIVDLNVAGLRLHPYIRLLEDAVIEVVSGLGLEAGTEAGATGVWLGGGGGRRTAEKVCAIGVRVRRWVTMHGLALNVTTDLSHFDLIVPCGLSGRGVTSLAREIPGGGISVEGVKPALVGALCRRLGGG